MPYQVSKTCVLGDISQHIGFASTFRSYEQLKAQLTLHICTDSPEHSELVSKRMGVGKGSSQF